MSTMKKILNNMNNSYLQILNAGTQENRKIFPQGKLISRCRNLCHGKF